MAKTHKRSRVKQNAHQHGTASFEAILETLRHSTLRITEPRKAILRILTDKHGPFSAEQIHAQITKKVCDLATVYRSLATLEKARFVKRCEFGDGVSRYELSVGANQHHHHHVICKECKKIETLDDCELADIDEFAKKTGFSEVSHTLEFFGICPDCR